MIKKNDQKRMIKKNCPYGFPGIYIYIPGTQMTLVLVGKGLVLEG